MIRNTSTGRRWALALGATAAVIGIGMATPAMAHGWHGGGGWHGGWGWGSPRIGIGFGYPYGYGYGYGFAYAPPVYYAAPPAAYYAQGGYYSQSSVTVTGSSHRTVRHHVTHKTNASVCPAPSSATSTSTSASQQPAVPGPQASAGPQVSENSAY
jgi:hypothetical protein